MSDRGPDTKESDRVYHEFLEIQRKALVPPPCEPCDTVQRWAHFIATSLHDCKFEINKGDPIPKHYDFWMTGENRGWFGVQSSGTREFLQRCEPEYLHILAKHGFTSCKRRQSTHHGWTNYGLQCLFDSSALSK
jgi:hypothetical protein